MSTGISQPDDAPASGDARKRILSSARRHFATAGFEGAATRQIAAEAGVAQSLLLYHFGSKDALWRAVMDDLFAGLTARMAVAARDTRAEPVHARLLSVIRAFIAFCAEDADIHRIMTIEGRQASERLKWLVDRHLREIHLGCSALIREGQQAGVVRAGDPTLLYYSVIAIAGTAFSLAPEIALVSGNSESVDTVAIESLIRSLLFVDG
jgi:TetR/AcrR family transcriptional regulator